MERKPLTLTKEDEKLNAIVKDHKEIEIKYRERNMFIMKQLKNMENQMVEEGQANWRRIEERLKELDKLPKDYNPKTDNLSLKDDGVIFFERAYQGEIEPPKGMDSFLDLLKGLLPPPPKK